MSCSLGKQKCGLISVMFTTVTIAGLLSVISLSVALVQINSESKFNTVCHPCDDHVSRGKKIDKTIINSENHAAELIIIILLCLILCTRLIS